MQQPVSSVPCKKHSPSYSDMQELVYFHAYKKVWLKKIHPILTIFFVENCFGRKNFSSKTPCDMSKVFLVENFPRRSSLLSSEKYLLQKPVYPLQTAKIIWLKIFSVEKLFLRNFFRQKNSTKVTFRRKKSVPF